MSNYEKLKKEFTQLVEEGMKGNANKNGPFAAGPGGKCVCPECGATKKHTTGTPCTDENCPKCETKMTRNNVKKKEG